MALVEDYPTQGTNAEILKLAPLVFGDQADFMNLGGQFITTPNGEQMDLYANLIQEETDEFLEAHYALLESEPEASIKEAADVIVVAAGYLISKLGVVNAQEAWRLVHASNLRKLEGSVEKREDGKILKNAEGKAERKAKLLSDLKALLPQ
jgi:hypothetical protein